MDKLFDSFTPEQQREDRKLRTLQRIVDSAGRLIVTGTLSKEQAQALADKTRKDAENIIPDQMELYDRIYGARFQHWIDHFCTD